MQQMLCKSYLPLVGRNFLLRLFLNSKCESSHTFEKKETKKLFFLLVKGLMLQERWLIKKRITAFTTPLFRICLEKLYFSHPSFFQSEMILQTAVDAYLRFNLCNRIDGVVVCIWEVLLCIWDFIYFIYIYDSLRWTRHHAGHVIKLDTS